MRREANNPADLHRVGDPTMNAAGIPEGALAGPEDGRSFSTPAPEGTAIKAA
jgi:hypothetical protein